MTSTRTGRVRGLTAAIWMMGVFTPQFAAQKLSAADRRWDNVNGGFFSEPANWFGGVPGTDDVARFETTDSTFFQREYIVDFTTAITNHSLIVEDDDVTFNLKGRTYELKNPFVAAALGTVPNRSGDLTVIRGALVLPNDSILDIASVAHGKGSLTVGSEGRLVNNAGAPELKVGRNGEGVLEITNGGGVIANSVVLGENFGSTGTVTVTGIGSGLLIRGDLDMLGAGSGTLRIKTGGSVVARDLFAGDNDELHLEGGSLDARFVNSFNFFWSSGTISFRQFSDDLTVPNDGVLSPSLSLISHVSGDLTLLPGGTILITEEIPGFTKLQVDGQVDLDGGNLQVKGDMLSSEAKVEILTTEDGIFGSFANVANGQRLAAGDGSFLVNYGPGSPFDPKSVFISSYLPATPGDFDVDGDVDGNDFLDWQRGDSPNGGNAVDLVAWRKNFGASGAAAASSAVPEPSDGVLLLSGLLLLIVQTRKGVRRAENQAISTRAGRRHWRVAAIGIIALFISQSAAQPALAIDKLWENVEGGVFSEPNNWFPVGVPGEEDIVRFETTNSNFFQRTYTVDFHTDAINQQLVVEDDAVTFNLMGHTYELTNKFVGVALGTVPHRSGNLTVTNGTLMLPVLADLEIAAVADGSGALTVGAGGNINGAGFLGGPELKVGLNGKGTFEINGGGFVNADGVTIGVNSGSTGTEVIVTGNGSLLQSGNLDMSSAAGSGTLRIESGGRVTANDVRLGGNHELRLEGGRLHAASMSNSPGFIWTAGTLSCTHFSGALTVPNGGVLAADSRVQGNLTLSPGAATQFRVTAEFNQAGQIQVDGHVVVESGTLQLSLDDDVLPSPQAKFELIKTGTGIFGTFANVANGQRLATGDGSVLVNYGPGSPFDPTSVFISSYLPATPGDFDVDGDVDGNDFLVWQRGGSPNGGNAADLVAWRVNFGTSGTAAASGAVPEPSGGWIALAAIGAACAVRPGSGAVFAKSHRLKKRATNDQSISRGRPERIVDGRLLVCAGVHDGRWKRCFSRRHIVRDAASSS